MPPQQVTVEDGAQGGKLIVLPCYVCLFPGLGKKVACVPTPKSLVCPAYGQSNLPGVPRVFLGYRDGFTKHEGSLYTKDS